MRRYVLALDLDRTLFDTDAFSVQLAKHSAELLGTDASIFMAEMEQHKVGQESGLQYYDYYGHMSARGVQVDEGMQDYLVRSLSQSPSFLYDDVAAFLKKLQDMPFDTCILTYGEPRYQQLKYNISLSLHQLPLHTTLQDKSVWLASRYPVPHRGILVDDKDAYTQLPPNWRLFHLRRDKGELLRVSVLSMHIA